MKRAVLGLAVFACLALPAGASAAPSGAITNVFATSDGQISATYTTSFDVCTSYGYCGFYAHAWQIPATDQCAEYNNDHLTYVSTDFRDDSGTIVETDTFYPRFTPVRICLFARHASEEYFIADYVHGAPAASPGPAPVTPTPTPTPAPTTDEFPPMTISEARNLLPEALADKYGRRFTRSGFRRSCLRLSQEKVRCQVSWRKRPHRYSGQVTLWNDPDDPSGAFLYKASVKRKRM